LLPSDQKAFYHGLGFGRSGASWQVC